MCLLLGCGLAWGILRVISTQVSSECAEEGAGSQRAALLQARATCLFTTRAKLLICVLSFLPLSWEGILLSL